MDPDLPNELLCYPVHDLVSNLFDSSMLPRDEPTVSQYRSNAADLYDGLDRFCSDDAKELDMAGGDVSLFAQPEAFFICVIHIGLVRIERITADVVSETELIAS